jgi:hypothetical protein
MEDKERVTVLTEQHRLFLIRGLRGLTSILQTFQLPLSTPEATGIARVLVETQALLRTLESTLPEWMRNPT